MKRQDYVFGSTTTNVEEQSASALNNGWAELSILYSRVLNGVCAALSQSTNYVSQEVANAIEGMGAELDPADNSQLLTVLQSLAIKESDFQTPVTPTNKGATMKEIEDLVTTSFVFKGYVSTTAPAQNLVEGNLWINSATMPTNFPIAAAAVKQWNGSEWVAYGSAYTPGNFDCFRNLNDNEGYYWFGGEWQVISTDLSTDYFTLNQVSGRWEIKNSIKLPGTPTVDTPTENDTNAIANVEFVKKSTVAPGIVAPFAGITAPAGWLKCDGSAISRTRYAELFAVLGTGYGAGDGYTTFNLPTQSVLPLGTQANIITKQDGAATTQAYRFLSNNQVAGNGLAAIENGISYLSNQTGTEFYLDLGSSSYADLANATGATAIVCIKY